MVQPIELLFFSFPKECLVCQVFVWRRWGRDRSRDSLAGKALKRASTAHCDLVGKAQSIEPIEQTEEMCLMFGIGIVWRPAGRRPGHRSRSHYMPMRQKTK